MLLEEVSYCDFSVGKICFVHRDPLLSGSGVRIGL